MDDPKNALGTDGLDRDGIDGGEADDTGTTEGRTVPLPSRRAFFELCGGLAAAGGLVALTGCTIGSLGSSSATDGSDQQSDDAASTESTEQPAPAEEQSTYSTADDTTAATRMRYDVVDSHLHYLDFLQKTDGFSSLVGAMDTAGVSQSVIFGMAMAKQWDEDSDSEPTYYLSNDSRCYYYSATDFLMIEQLKAQPANVQARFLPFVCGINPNDRYALAHIKQALELYPNTFCGIGELMSRHDDLTALTYGEPPHLDHPAFLEIFDYAAEQGLPVLVHHNITAANTSEVLYLDELKAALAHNRECAIIWAHIGISRRVEVPDLDTLVEQLLDENSNLFIDISWVVYDYYFLDENPDRFDDGVTLEDWVALMEKYPDRFMIGTDKVGHWETYPDEVVKYYTLLDRLSPDTARKLCHDNILGLVKTYG